MKRLWIVVPVALVVTAVLTGRAGPDWWTTQGVISTNAPADYAVLNIGQLKHLASTEIKDTQKKDLDKRRPLCQPCIL